MKFDTTAVVEDFGGIGVPAALGAVSGEGGHPGVGGLRAVAVDSAVVSDAVHEESTGGSCMKRYLSGTGAASAG